MKNVEKSSSAGTTVDSSTNADVSSVSQPIAKPNVVRRLKCWLGFHDWVNIDTTPFPKIEHGEMYCYSDLHECEHCKKREYKGMGCVC